MSGSLRATLALALAILPALPASAPAAGELDRSFSQDGKVSLVAAGSFVVRAVAVQPDGRILAGGYTCEPGPSRSGLCTADGDSSFRIARFTADGELDSEWGDRGLVTTPVGTGRSQIFDLLVQPDGGVLAGGAGRYDDRDGFALARFDARGALKSVTFTPVGTGFSAIADLTAAPGGAVIAVGQAGDENGRNRVAIARYDAAGNLDGAFGAFGTVMSGASPYGFGLGGWVAPDGSVMAAGIAGTSPEDVTGHRTGVVRVTSSGGADSGFSADGAADYAVGTSSSFANALTGLPDGRWLSAGVATDGEGRQVMALVRGTPAGVLDPGWDGDGIALVRPLAGGMAADVVRLDDGRVLVAGHASTGTGEVRFAVARLDANGRLDPLFGGGAVTTEWSRFPVARATAIAVDRTGRPVVAGVGCSAGAGVACVGGSAHLALARYQDGPTPAQTHAPGASRPDARAPGVAMIPFPRAYRRRTLVRRGLLVRVRSDEVARVTVSLRVRRGRRTVTIARRELPFDAGRRSLRVRGVARRLPRRRFTLRVVIRVADRTANVAVLRRAVRIR